MGSQYVRSHRDGRAGGHPRVVLAVVMGAALAILRLRLGTVYAHKAQRGDLTVVVTPRLVTHGRSIPTAASSTRCPSLWRSWTSGQTQILVGGIGSITSLSQDIRQFRLEFKKIWVLFGFFD